MKFNFGHVTPLGEVVSPVEGGRFISICVTLLLLLVHLLLARRRAAPLREQAVSLPTLD